MRVLEDKIVIITGARSGIGRAAAKLFVRHGARIVVNARGREGLDSLVREIADEGGEAVALAGDIADEGTHVELVALARARFGGLDVALNNAGTLGPLQPTNEVDARAWEEALRVNLTAAFFAAKHQIPALSDRGGGSLVFTSTFVGHTVGMPGMAAYSASKAGVLGLVQSLAAELGPRRIRVNALLPGGTDTPMGREVASTPEVRAAIERMHALRRIAEPEEIAASALYLASDLSSFTTGAALLADGGISIYRG